MYVKKPDRIETYLIRVINRFFDTEIKSIENSRESIVLEALKRLKEDGLAMRGREVRRAAVSIPPQSEVRITVKDPSVKEGSVVTASLSEVIPAGVLSSLTSVDGVNQTFTVSLFNASTNTKNLPDFTVQYSVLNR